MGKLKDFVKRNVTSIKKDVKKVTSAVKKGVSNLGIKALLPFKIPMTKILDARKIKYNSSSLEDIADKFYRNVVGGRTGANYSTKTGRVGVQSIDPVTIGIIVPAIIEFIKGLIDKKKRGEVLSKEEELAVNAAETFADEMDKIDEEPEDGEFNFNKLLSNPLVILMLIGLLIYLFRNR